MKQLAKSLHTVSVLVNVARHLIATGQALSATGAVNRALVILGHDDKTDVYDLIGAAIKQLQVK